MGVGQLAVDASNTRETPSSPKTGKTRYAMVSPRPGKAGRHGFADAACAFAERLFQLLAGLLQRRGEVTWPASDRSRRSWTAIGAADRFGLVGEGGFEAVFRHRPRCR